MRWFLLLWFAPISFLVSWLALAANDLSFGVFLFSREMYDTVFGVYAALLGVPAESLPPLVVRALILDSAIVLGLYALRRWRPIWAFLRTRFARYSPDASASKAESLSSAP